MISGGRIHVRLHTFRQLITRISATHLAVAAVTAYVLATAVYPSILLPWYFNTRSSHTSKRS